MPETSSVPEGETKLDDSLRRLDLLDSQTSARYPIAMIEDPRVESDQEASSWGRSR